MNDLSPNPSARYPAVESSRVDRLLAEGRRALASAPHAPSAREASLLLGHVLGLDEARLWARDHQEVMASDVVAYRRLLDRRVAGEPAAYLLGRREFWGRDFVVDDRVLIPRPETEHLVEVALALDLPTAPTVVDVGTGSGCLAISLAAEWPDARVIATDHSIDALAVTATNADRYEVGDRVVRVHTHLADGVRLDRVDLMISNPPYIDPAIADTLSPEVVDHEPASALFAECRGTAILSALLDGARALRPGALLVLEIGFDQGDWLLTEIARRPWLDTVELRRDYAGHPRVGVVRRLAELTDGGPRS